MSSSTFTINGVECRARGNEIDLRKAGFLKTSIPPELLNHPRIKTILLFHENVPKFLESIIDNLGPQLSINVFVDNNNKSCEIKTDELRLIGLDVRCNALNVIGVIAACKQKLRRLVLRNYECDSLDGLDRTTISDLEELAIASDDMLSVNLDIFYCHILSFSFREMFPDISFQNITLKMFPDSLTKLDTTSQCNTISLEGMTNLQRFLLCAKGKKILPTGMDQLNNLQELFIFDDPIGEDFELCDKLKQRKVILFNCGLKVLPLAITAMEELEVLELYFNNFDNQLSLAKLVKLKRLFIYRCFRNAYLVGLEKLTNLESLYLGGGNIKLGQQSFTFTSLKNLKQLDMSNCGLKKVPDGLENCVNLEVLSLAGNSELGQQSFTFTSLKNLKQLDMLDCGLKKIPDGLENNIGLINCDMSFNKLKEFPKCFANLIESGTNFNLAGNVLEKPPQVICNDGRSILNYFKSIDKFREVHSKRLRVLVIGNSGAGKTSLVNGLLMGESRPTAENERTEGIEIRKWYPNPDNEDIELEIWDFGGHMEYQSVSHYFFEKHSLFLLVLDVSKYETTDESYDENAGKWIDELKSIVARPVIMVAATKSDLVDHSNLSIRCQDMLKRINKQEKLDVDSIKSDLENLDENDSSNTCRKEKLNSLAAERPVLPKEIVLTLDEREESGYGDTCIVVTSAGRRVGLISYEELNVSNLSQELVRTGNNMNLFPHLKTKLPLLWVKIEKLLPTLREEMENKNLSKYLTFEELEKSLCQHLEMFNEIVKKKETLHDVILYLVKLGKVLHFEHVKQLRDLIFPDPQWLIMLVKEVVHHDLESHLTFREEFRACNMDAVMFEKEKQELLNKGLLSDSLLRCIWFDAVPKLLDVEKLVPLLCHFDVGYKMTVKEAEFEGKEFGKNYTFIPALMPEALPSVINDVWPTTASQEAIERSCEYIFLSTLPVGLFERHMVRSHHCSDYRIHWKEGFFGINSEEQEEVKFCITKRKNKIRFTVRTSKNGQINTVWKVVLNLHQIFADMVQELWPELRYRIYNKCPECNVCHYEMEFERLLRVPDSYSMLPRCDKTGQIIPVKVDSTLVIPPPEVVKEFQKNKGTRTSTGVSSPVMVSEIPYLVMEKICRLLNVESSVGGNYKILAGMLGMKTNDVWLLSQKDDPTNEVLKWWVPKNWATVQKFREILKEMERYDVLAVLDGKKQSDYQEHQPPQKN